MQIETERPRDQLVGRTLSSGWRIVRRLDRKQGDTGGNFGVGYVAERGPGELAFVKAIDYLKALRSTNAAEELHRLTQEFAFEREVLEYCEANDLTKVISFYGHEDVHTDDSRDASKLVSCLIMEAGDKDIRRLVNDSGGPSASCAWNLFVLSDITLAASQLHKHGIAHHDLKPSNVIAVKPPSAVASIAEQGDQGRQHVKVGDLGRVLRRNASSPYNQLPYAGDPQYQPIEIHYGHFLPDWVDAREAADAYMIGSLAFFLFTGVSIQTLLHHFIPPTHYPRTWRGAYDSDLIAVLDHGHARALHEHLLPKLPAQMAGEVLSIVKSLTRADPKLRGHDKARRSLGRPVGMDRIHQQLNLLAKRCAATERAQIKATAGKA